MVEVTNGMKVRYKVNKGRSRPAVGEVLRKAGVFVEIKNLRSNEVVRVSPKMITGEYTFKPYRTRAA